MVIFRFILISVFLFLYNLELFSQVIVKYYQAGNDTTIHQIIKSSIFLNKNQRNLTLFIENKKGDTIQYNLEGLEKKWHTCSCQEINYIHLDGGEYIFVANKKGEDKIISKLKVDIEPSFYQQWWFAPSLFFYLLIVFGVVLYLFMNYRLRQQLRLQSVRHELEIKALRAQMNPHFIFNCMNTIDAYILRKKFLEASDYLQKFSKLIRKILENSESQTISIEQEIQTLKLYISLEQERFSHSFISYFDIEPELMEQDYQIPSLVLQPFVENAILHGIRHLTERKGMISIILKKIKNESGEGILLCIVQDNGVGRKASSVINEQRPSHKSMGVNVTLERINTYQAIYGNKMETIVSDLDEGTRVEIRLPLLKE